MIKLQAIKILGFQHGGRLSPWSTKNTSIDDNARNRAKAKALENRSSIIPNTQLEYWIQKTGGDIETAKRLLSERQCTFSKDKCIERYGYEKGLEMWEIRQKKWKKSLMNSGYRTYSSIISKLEMEFYNRLSQVIDIKHQFALYDERQ